MSGALLPDSAAGDSAASSPPDSRGPDLGERIWKLLSPRRISGVYLWIILIVVYSFTTSSFFTATTARTR